MTSPTIPFALTPQLALRALLVFVAIAPLAYARHAGDLAVFTCSALAILPLAGLMGEATEALAGRFGAGVGGLLNATFGNAAELILALVALQRGMLGVVKASLTGSIIGNTLLVLGLAMLAGGAKRERQTFDRSAASASSTLLVLAALALLVPAAFHAFTSDAVVRGALAPARQALAEHGLSLFIAGVLFVTYLLGLLFSLRTHRHLFAGHVTHEGPPEPVGRALVTLVASTALVAWMSELLVGAVQGASAALGFTPVFVGVVIVAVVGNAAEHSTAVMMAMRDQMDLALHIAVGSSIQIALFVAPVLVFASRLMTGRPMDLVFTPFEVLATVAAAGIVHMVASDGESNWFEGVMLVAVYAVLALAFFFLP